MLARLIVLCIFLAFAAVGCMGTDEERGVSATWGSSETKWSETALFLSVGNAFESDLYRLRCDPPGGNVPRPAELCDILNANTDLMLPPAKPRMACLGGLGTSHTMVFGRFRGEEVSGEVSGCAGNAVGERLWLDALRAPPAQSG